MKCASCQRPIHTTRCTRGLCRGCYSRHLRAGTHVQFPSKYWRSEELLAEYEWLAQQGYDIRAAADRLGIKYSRLERAIHRAKRRTREDA